MALQYPREVARRTGLRLSSAGEFDGRDDYVRIENTDLGAEAAADRIIRHFDLR